MTIEETRQTRGGATPRRASGAAGVRRLATVGLAIAAGLYAVGVCSAYLWLHYARNADQIRFADVALGRVQRVRRGMADQQFAQARVELGRKNFRGAYIAFATALRRDPDNVAGRLEAARFFGAAGSVKMEVTVLEEGLARAPGDLALANATFAVLTSTGRDRAAIDLIRSLYGDRPSDENAPLVEIYRMLATMNLGSTDAAEKDLSAHPEVRRAKVAVPALAMVLWRAQNGVEAIEVLSRYVAGGSAPYASYSQLAEWQAAGGMADDAVATARGAVAKFPDEVAPRVLLLEMMADRSPASREVQREAERFISENKGRPEAMAALGELAGQKGWVDVARNIYLAAADRQPDLQMLALYYADALAKASRFADEQAVLNQVEVQSEGSSQSFLVQLRRREVLAAAARGDHDAVRENARYLAAALQRNDPENVELYRRLFVRLGIKDALGAFPAQ